MKEKDAEFSRSLSEACERLSSLGDESGFIDLSEVGSVSNIYRSLRDDAGERSKKITFSLGLVNKALKNNILEFIRMYDDLPGYVDRHNQSIARSHIADIDRRINPVEGRDLDSNQLMSIAYDVRSRLVIAGAGTGKTTTIIGLVKELLSSGKAVPEDILLLSFTNASVNELKARIREETGERVETTTFHRLGLKAIAASDGKVPRISNIDINRFITDEIERRKSDPVYIRRLNDFIAYNYESIRDEDVFGNVSELREYLKEHPLITLNGEHVKSFGESDIANYLAMNGIPYVYEDAYEIDTSNEEHGQYHPDFHIAGTRVYIEYFGIDREGNVAPFMVDSDPNAKEDYTKGIEWKRQVHAANGTHLIELYAYNRSEGELIERLEEALKPFNLQYEPASPQEIFDRTFGKDRWRLRGLVSTFTTAILLIKGYGRSWDEVYPKGDNRHDKAELRSMEKVLRPLYDAYQERLMSEDEIDFEDMLNMAVDRIRKGGFVHQYGYVIVDEYQDLSRSRFNLLKAMRDSKDYKLFCVGDDWQSIYRFNGCDVSYILDFEGYWGPSTICCIDRTYRFSGELLEKSSRFIRNNRNQFQKKLVGVSDRDSRVYPLFGPDDSDIRRRIADRLRKVPKGKSVLFLGRYNHDVRILDSDGFSWKPDLSNNSQIITFSDRPDLDMRFMTIHSSKGLQADVVFSLNNKTGRYGFPSKRDEPVLISLLLGKGSDQYDEERRLFYVAMTRAKDVAYIVSVTGHQSDFYKELFPLRIDGRDVPQMVCPMCGGTLVLRKGAYSMFYGCSNFGPRGCKFTRKFEKGAADRR